MSTIKKTNVEASPIREYKYHTEICQMVWPSSTSSTMFHSNPWQMFVFGEVEEPNPETVNLVEDIVRSQLVELIVQARALATRRGSRYLSAEDLIFLIRHDRGKVNRLRTYLSWKDVRKHAKDSGGDGGPGVEVETLDDGADGETPGSAQERRS
jgi:transcription initiation protein SPT3